MPNLSMVIETVFAEGVAHLSYLVGDKKTGGAAVIDPRRNVEPHIELSRKERPVAVYCDSGYRASLGASLLRRAGFTDVRNVSGSWKAWASCARSPAPTLFANVSIKPISANFCESQ